MGPGPGHDDEEDYDDGLGLDPPGSNREDWGVDLDADVPVTEQDFLDD